MLQDFDGFSPRVDPTAWIHDAAILIGEVEVGPRASVWPTSVLRGDMGVIRIGEDTNIQDGTICHNTAGWSETLVGARCTVGHRVVLHGCMVEDDCLIGMGAVLMDNVRVGSGSLVAAGTLIPPGKVIPPGSFVLGSPGRVLRPVGERERKMIAGGWRSYAKKLAIWKGESSEN